LSRKQEKRNKQLSSIRAKVEHPFQVIKHWWGNLKVSGDFFKIAFFSKSIQKNLVHPENFTKHTILTSQKPF
jgi:hypothetical protein